jgi:peptidyl-prolyl cis-trans isomerase B (cyclophilin B)
MFHATLHTSKGPIRIVLHKDKVPHTIGNFITLANNGFYDNLNFHRVIEDFMVQAGCPIGNGTGWPGYAFGDEFHPELRHAGPWILSMANSGPDSNGSQFFITHIETPWLDGKHTVFGQVLDETDQDIVNKIAQWDQIISIEIHEDNEFIFPESAQTFMDQIQTFLDSQKEAKAKSEG